MISQILKKVVDGVKPTFDKGGKLSFLHSLFDAVETLLFVPDTVTKKGAHIRDAVDLKRSLIVVVLALVPALLFGMYNTGLQHFRAVGDVAAEASIWGCWWYGFVRMLPLILVSYVVGLGIEVAFAQRRGHEVTEGYFVTGMLIPLIMPIDVPLWMVALAVAFSVIIGKEVFGGSGMNIFNPALLARAFVFFAYTPFISGDKVWIRGAGKGGEYIDGFSGATPLTQLGENAEQMLANANVWDWIVGTIPGSIGETSVIAIAIGAVIMLATGVASWRIMLSVVAGGWLTGLLFNAIGASPVMDMPAYYHLLLGGFAFGAVFMATDPVTAAQTNVGKVVVGFLIGVIAVLIRVVNPGYPEGMMLAILFMNAMAPLVDHVVVGFNVRRRLSGKLTKGRA
ncbi:MAG: NADH:ubiquinone reductase (Na(+)-transporting) subunit B [Alistipes sp.]|jgi:Na+-transporting NADH:ubiquinone oxidoreductase subunit B|nr:NADH:ubiquinone reductase (Na(+)-transporting) subunit B [Alistipes sp.]